MYLFTGVRSKYGWIMVEAGVSSIRFTGSLLRVGIPPFGKRDGDDDDKDDAFGEGGSLRCWSECSFVVLV